MIWLQRPTGWRTQINGVNDAPTAGAERPRGLARGRPSRGPTRGAVTQPARPLRPARLAAGPQPAVARADARGPPLRLPRVIEPPRARQAGAPPTRSPSRSSPRFHGRDRASEDR